MNQWIDHDDGYDDQVILESLEGTETTEIDTGNLKILAPQILMEEYTFKNLKYVKFKKVIKSILPMQKT